MSTSQASTPTSESYSSWDVSTDKRRLCARPGCKESPSWLRTILHHDTGKTRRYAYCSAHDPRVG